MPFSVKKPHIPPWFSAIVHTITAGDVNIIAEGTINAVFTMPRWVKYKNSNKNGRYIVNGTYIDYTTTAPTKIDTKAALKLDITFEGGTYTFDYRWHLATVKDNTGFDDITIKYSKNGESYLPSDSIIPGYKSVA